MKYSELDFKGGSVGWDTYKGYPESKHFSYDLLSQDMLAIGYDQYTIDLGWYQDRYMIAIVDNKAEVWNPFYSVHVTKHEEVFDKLQEVINNGENYFKLKIFT